MKRTYLILSLFMVLGTLGFQGCQQQQQTVAQPTPPSQTVVQEYGSDQSEVDSAREKLTTLNNKIQDSLATWHQTPAPVGPQFDGEDDALAKQIIVDCDTLENDATGFSQQPYVHELEGQGVDIEAMIKFAQTTRDEIRKGKPARQDS